MWWLWALSCTPSSTPASPEDEVTGDSGDPVAILATSPTDHDFGEVAVGCAEELSLTLSSVGEVPVSLEAVELEGDSAFSLELAEELPLSLDPLDSVAATVRFAPTDQGAVNTSLAVSADVEDLRVELGGTGSFDDERSLSWVVGEQSKATALIHANETVISGPNGAFAERFNDALPGFFEGLLAHGSAFRVAFLWEINGEVHGPHAYIDESFTVEEAVEAVQGMLADGADGVDNDRAFTTLLAGLERNQDWLFEDESWADSQLSLMSFTNDTEQSGGSATTYGTTASSYKEDPADIVFHAIGGPLQDDCANAEPFTLFKEAVDATGGVFGSVCESDWTGHMSQLVGGVVVGEEVFSLTGTPHEPSIRVYVDDVEQASGWSYDAALNAVRFDEGAEPADGSTVRIEYVASGDCG